MKKIALFLSMLVASICLGQIPINQLPPATLPLTGSEQVPMVQGTCPSCRGVQASVSSIAATSAPNTNPFVLQSAGTGVPNARILTGTINEIGITDGGAGSTLTLSTPQPIGTASTPTFNNLILTADTGLLLGNGASPITVYSGVTCTNQFLSALSSVGAGTCTTATLASAQFANQGTTTTVLHGNAAGNPSFGQVALTTDVTGTLPATNGGTGQNTYVLGDTLFSNAANSLARLAGNTTSTQQFLSQTGTGTVSAAPVWSALPGSFSGFANPTGTVGLATVNGAATTAMRSDAAPPLSQAIVPTWTGAHTFTPGSAVVAVTVNAAANTFGDNILGSSTSGQSFGEAINAGTTAADIAFRVRNQALTAVFEQINGNGSGSLGPNVTNDLSWTSAGNWVFGAPTSGVGVAINGGIAPLTVTQSASPGANYTTTIQAATTSGQSHGLEVLGGTTSGDVGLLVCQATNVICSFQINGNGSGIIGPNSTTTWDTSNGWQFGAPSPAETAVTITAAVNQFGLLVNGATNTANTFLGEFVAGSATGFSSGVFISAGTNASDSALLVRNSAGSKNLFAITGAGAATSITGFGATAAASVDMTPDSGTFTGTLTGFAAGINVTCAWAKMGNVIVLVLDSNGAVDTGTSNATSMTMTGVPAEIQPAITQEMPIAFLEDNTTIAGGNTAQISGGTITLFKGTSSSGASWTASGTKGIQNADTVTYRLN